MLIWYPHLLYCAILWVERGLLYSTYTVWYAYNKVDSLVTYGRRQLISLESGILDLYDLRLTGSYVEIGRPIPSFDLSTVITVWLTWQPDALQASQLMPTSSGSTLPTRGLSHNISIPLNNIVDTLTSRRQPRTWNICSKPNEARNISIELNRIDSLLTCRQSN